MKTNGKEIIARLKSTVYKYSEANRIKLELRDLTYLERLEILAELRQEKNKSDNSDLIDIINDIINDLNK